MPRPKGVGAIKSIDATKHDPVEIRRRLHMGGEPIREKPAQLFINWRNLIAEREDCAKRLNAGKGSKWTRKRLKRLDREIDAKWSEVGLALGAMGDRELSAKLALLSKASQPAVYGWQEEATRQVDFAYLREGGDDKVLFLAGEQIADGKPTGKIIGRKVSITAQELYDHLRTEGYKMTIHDLRRFVRDTLKVTLRDERGRRRDLEQ